MLYHVGITPKKEIENSETIIRVQTPSTLFYCIVEVLPHDTTAFTQGLVNQKKEQKYGTQAFLKRTINPLTGEPEATYYIWPIKIVKSVNKRRKKAGFSNIVEENAKLMDINYTIVTLKEIESDSF